MTTIIFIIAIIYCVLNIILFFKIWGATNDIKRIKQTLCSGKEPKKENKTSTSSTQQAMIDAFVRTGEKSSKFKEGEWVVQKGKNNELMYIESINDKGEYICITQDGKNRIILTETELSPAD